MVKKKEFIYFTYRKPVFQVTLSSSTDIKFM